MRKTIALCDNTFKQPHLLEQVIVPAIVESLGGTYNELERNFEKIQQVIAYEDETYKDLLKSTSKSLLKMSFDGIAIEDVVDYPGFIPGCRNLDKMLDVATDKTKLTGDMMYELYKSNGLDEEILLKIAEWRNLTPDLNGFHVKTEEEKERKRTMLAHRNKGHDFEYFATLPVTDNHFKYVYQFDADAKVYAIPSVSATVLATEKDINKDGVYHVVTDRSNFYFTAGGQESDAGWMTTGNGIKFEVTEVSSTETGVVVHTGRFLNGRLSVGDSVDLSVEPMRRTGATLHHSGNIFTHMYDVYGQNANIKIPLRNFQPLTCCRQL